MNIYDYIIIAAVAAAFVAAIVFMIRRRRRGCSCCGSCPYNKNCGSCDKRTDRSEK